MELPLGAVERFGAVGSCRARVDGASRAQCRHSAGQELPGGTHTRQAAQGTAETGKSVCLSRNCVHVIRVKLPLTLLSLAVI